MYMQNELFVVNEFMAPQTLLFLLYSSLFLALFQRSSAKPYCPPSSCGIITNITSPFRLNTDPNYCGDRGFELVCENNLTIIYLNSHKYYVKAINYTSSVIRVVDASINNHTCSFPTTSLYSSINLGNEKDNYLYYIGRYINLMSCPYPLKNSSLYTDVSHCHSSSSRFTYIKIGGMKASDVTEACRVDVRVVTAWEFKDLNNVSLEEIHSSLLYGFVLGFESYRSISGPTRETFMEDVYYKRLRVPFQIILLILAISGAAVYPIIIILGVCTLLFPIAYGLHYTIRYNDSYFLNTAFTGYAIYDPSNFSLITNIMIISGPRFIIGLFVGWVLICKYRRRHLSRFDAIEKFLQSDNKLVPIRYSYSDIKRMTTNFRDKLGEGGFGSVYKGKLRSGHYVAVKLLGKSGANEKPRVNDQDFRANEKSRASDQDFMNEITTIGRIHHVNIVTLVGYCAEGSKRALVLDFMPIGSLEKYIFDKEKMNDLNWDMKFGIVIGVARGIEYLHRGCDIQILHFDIKPHNILLDDKFIPKISDFGLAKSYSKGKNTLTLTAARGTIGYVAPELNHRCIGRVSYKADVYSFGMLLMGLVGLNRDLEGCNDDPSKCFPYWIYDRFNQDKDIKIGSVDENDDNESTRILVRKMTIVALWCIQMNPDVRPSMNKVLEMLEGEVERLEIPQYSSISLHEDENLGASSTYSDSASLLHYNHPHDVEITIEDFHSRY